MECLKWYFFPFLGTLNQSVYCGHLLLRYKRERIVSLFIFRSRLRSVPPPSLQEIGAHEFGFSGITGNGRTGEEFRGFPPRCFFRSGLRSDFPRSPRPTGVRKSEPSRPRGKGEQEKSFEDFETDKKQTLSFSCRERERPRTPI